MKVFGIIVQALGALLLLATVGAFIAAIWVGGDVGAKLGFTALLTMALGVGSFLRNPIY